MQQSQPRLHCILWELEIMQGQRDKKNIFTLRATLRPHGSTRFCISYFAGASPSTPKGCVPRVKMWSGYQQTRLCRRWGQEIKLLPCLNWLSRISSFGWETKSQRLKLQKISAEKERGWVSSQSAGKITPEAWFATAYDILAVPQAQRADKGGWWLYCERKLLEKGRVLWVSALEQYQHTSLKPIEKLSLWLARVHQPPWIYKKSGI